MRVPGERWQWADTPATTIAGDPRITAREHHFEGEQNSTSFKLTIEEAAILQTFPPFKAPECANVSMAGRRRHEVVDLFAGSGVGVALKKLGATEYGVEKMPEAIATRTANGMRTIYEDVWDVRRLDAMVRAGFEFDTLWASPPCQAFSMAGGGAGRRALDAVLGVIARKQYLDMNVLREQAVLLGDERIGLVLTPLHYAARFMPTYIAFEQVPPVLPVWEAMAVELRELGYSVWTGILHAEQFGVPQTRKRAILMARRDGVAVTPPVPTHSKYYPRDKTRLDPGVEKWVSMEEALGWGATARPMTTVTGGGGSRDGGSGSKVALDEARASGQWTQRVVISNYGTSGDPKARGERLSTEPSATVTAKVGRNRVVTG